jgi:hypothetical protein
LFKNACFANGFCQTSGRSTNRSLFYFARFLRLFFNRVTPTPAAQAVSKNFLFFFRRTSERSGFLAMLVVFIVGRHQTGNFHLH